MNRFQDLKCLFNIHKYEIHNEEELYNFRGDKIGKVIISVCSNCGNIKYTNIYTVKDTLV